MKRLLKKVTQFENHIIVLLLLFMGIVYSTIAIASHSHFETFGWDLGFFDQIIWKVSRGDLVAYSTIAHENLLADHFQVVLYFLAPLYILKNDVRIILMAQSFLVVLAGYPLYVLAKAVTKSFFFSVSIVLSYLFFLGTQWTTLNEFHQAAFIPLFLAVSFYGLQLKKKWIYLLGIVGLLITKEELGLLVFFLGFTTWWWYKQKLLGIVTSLIGIISFFFLVYFIMPHISAHGTYSHFDFGQAGYTPVDVIKKSIFDPFFVVKSMIYPSVKIKTMFDSFFAFGFMPLLSPLFLIPILGNFASRFIYAGPQFTKWLNVNHHAAPLGILLSVATIYTALKLAAWLEKRRKVKINTSLCIIALYLLITTLVQNVLLHGPINSIFKSQLYQRAAWMDDNMNVLAHVPPEVPIAAQNSMLPHLSQRKKIYLLPEINDAEYIVVDLHDGPNKYSPLSQPQLKYLLKNLIDKNQFTNYYSRGDALILKKIKV